MSQPRWRSSHDILAKKELARIQKMLEKKLTIPAVLPTTPDNLIDWTTHVRKIRGMNFSFEGRDYLKQIYGDSNKRIMIVKPRQMEITEFALNWLLFNLDKNQHSVGLYLTDRQSHVSVFSKLRLQNRAIGESPILQSLVNKKSNVSLLTFKNGSQLWMYSAWPDFEQARSIPVDFAVVDEIQSTNVEAIPVMEEALSKSRFGKFLYIGTGSVIGDSWWNLWHKGNQQEWDDSKKIWTAKNPSSEISSYHLTQYVAPWISKEKLAYNRSVYTPSRFANEVEGWWYGGASKPLTESEMRFCFNKNISLQAPDEVDYSHGDLYLGVDWGGGAKAFTIPWIWQCVENKIPIFRLIYVARIEERSTEKQAKMIASLIDAYKIKQGVMDAGGAPYQVQKIEEQYPGTMIKCHYIQRPENPFEEKPDENMILADRTWTIESVIDLIQRPMIDEKHPQGIPRMYIPASDPQKVEWIIDHFTAIQGETVQLSSGKTYTRCTHPEELPDDALHACNYAYLAWLYGRKSEWGWFSI